MKESTGNKTNKLKWKRKEEIKQIKMKGKKGYKTN